MKKQKSRGIKKLKKTFYRGRTTKFKRVIVFMAAAGILASLLYLIRYVYISYAAAEADIVLTYPEIAQSQKPDGSRFTYYEFLSDEMLNAALEKMQQKGKYTNYTVNSLRDSFELYSYLKNSASASVSSSRSAGNDFSYVANEYRIFYTQPHDYENSNFIRKIFSRDNSVDFLNALVEVNQENLANVTGGAGGFAALAAAPYTEHYDYSEILRVYRSKIQAIANFLNVLHSKAPDFVTAEGLSLRDIRGKYNFLISDKLDGISNFIESSGVTKDAEQTSNKLHVNIEDRTLDCNQYKDRSQINKFAIDNYDHTFTENLINVIQTKRYGLYQARPKTAFDTVVAQKHAADENIAECNAAIQEYKRELSIYTAKPSAEQNETQRLTSKCEELIQGFEKQYAELSKTAVEAVREYYNNQNRGYLTAKVSHNKLLSVNLLIKTGFVFGVGAIFAFIAAIFFDTVWDARKLKKKKRKLQAIKRAAQERGESEWE